MAKLLLPLQRTFRDPTEPRREVILFIPGATTMDKHQLHDILQAQQEIIPAEMKTSARERPQRRYSKENIAGALRDYRRYVNRKQAER